MNKNKLFTFHTVLLFFQSPQFFFLLTRKEILGVDWSNDHYWIFFGELFEFFSVWQTITTDLYNRYLHSTDLCTSESVILDRVSIVLIVIVQYKNMLFYLGGVVIEGLSCITFNCAAKCLKENDLVHDSTWYIHRW